MVLQTFLLNKLNQLFTESMLCIFYFCLLLLVLLLQNLKIKLFGHTEADHETNSIHTIMKVAWYTDKNWFKAAIFK